MSEDGKKAAEEVQVRLSEPSVLELATAIDKYGESAVFWAWRNILTPFLPVAAMIASENTLAGQMKKQELTIEEALDGMALIACLKSPRDPHKAWLPAEAILRHTKNAIDPLLAALGGQALGEPH